MNVLAEVDRMIRTAFAERVFLATVQGVTGNQITVRRLGQLVDEGPYPAAAGLAAAVSAGHTVRVERLGATFVVTLRIVT